MTGGSAIKHSCARQRRGANEKDEMIRRAVIAALFSLLALAAPLHAEDAIAVTANKFNNQFPTRLTFALSAQSRTRIKQAALTIQLDGQPASSRFLPEFTPGTAIETTYEWSIARNYVPPGVSGQFWWMIQDDAGNSTTTPKQNFRVEDSTYAWKKLSADRLVLYWYNGGDGFGKALFDRSVEAMKYLEQDTGVTVERPVQVWIYGNRTEFFRALGPGAREWTGGRAHPEFGIILIHVEPNALEWGKAATAHEVAHIVVREKVRGPLGGLSMPQWLDEGLAVYYETIPNKLDRQFSDPLKRAIQNDTLLSLRAISGGFPSSSSEANLAYAEGYSVVDFIFRRYGANKMTQLLGAFQVGGYYDDVLRAVLGVDSDGLENEWRKDIGAKPRAVSTRALVAPSRMPTFSLSTDPTLAPKDATPTLPAVALNATPAPPAPTNAPSAPVNPISTWCGSGLSFIALGGFAGVRFRQRAARR